MQGNGTSAKDGPKIDGYTRKELRNLSRFLAAWCDAVGVHPADLAQRAEKVKARWAAQEGMSATELKRFGSSRPHFYRLLKGQITIEYGDRRMLQYLSEIFEIDVAQLFDTLADRVWPTVHLAPDDYIEAPLQDPQARGARYLFPPEQLAGCPMHHLYLELAGQGRSSMHRHFAGTEMMRLDEGEQVTIRFPTRAVNRREIVLRRGEAVFFDATLPHQVVNTSDTPARLFVSRNYNFDDPCSTNRSDMNHEARHA